MTGEERALELRNKGYGGVLIVLSGDHGFIAERNRSPGFFLRLFSDRADNKIVYIKKGSGDTTERIIAAIEGERQ